MFPRPAFSAFCNIRGALFRSPRSNFAVVGHPTYVLTCVSPPLASDWMLNLQHLGLIGQLSENHVHGSSPPPRAFPSMGCFVSCASIYSPALCREILPQAGGTPPAAAVSAEADQYFVWAEMMRRAGCKVERGAEQVTIRRAVTVYTHICNYIYIGLFRIQPTVFIRKYTNSRSDIEPDAPLLLHSSGPLTFLLFVFLQEGTYLDVRNTLCPTALLTLLSLVGEPDEALISDHV